MVYSEKDGRKKLYYPTSLRNIEKNDDKTDPIENLCVLYGGSLAANRPDRL